MFAMADVPDAVDVTPDALRQLPLIASFRPEGVKVKGVAVRGDLAYAVAGYGGFFVVDAGDPGRLTLLGKCDTPGNATEVAIRGRYAYVADRPAGIQIIDINDPANPRIVGLYDSVELATGLDIAGNLLAICNRSSGIEFADLADPIVPKHLSALRLGEAQGIRVRGNLAYVGLWHNRKLAVVDIENPRRPVLRGEAALGGYGWGICPHRGFVYAATGHHAPGQGGTNRGHGLDVVDVRDPSNPRSVKRLNTPPHYRLGNDWWWVTASGSHVFHADGENGVLVYDITDPANPKPVAHAETADYSGAVALLEDRILVADMTGGLRLFAAEGLAAPAPQRIEPARDIPPAEPVDAAGPGYIMYQTQGQARRMAVMGDYAIVAAGMGGLEVLSLSPTVKRVATVETPGVAFDVKVGGNRMYAALGSAGVAVLDAADPPRAQIIGRFEGRSADHVQPVGEFLATMRGEGGVDLLDVRDASAPALLARGSIPHFPSQLSALGDRHLIGVSPWEIAVFDAAQPGQLTKTVLSKTDRDGASGVMVQGARALLCRPSELELWDMADLDDIRLLGSLGLPPRSGGVVEWRGSRAVICNRVTGAATFVEVGEDGEMELLKATRLPGYPGKATIHGERVLVPCGYSGLAIINWEDIPKL